MDALDRLPSIAGVRAAAAALAGHVRRTPLVPVPSGDPRVELRLKLENLQWVGAFKARGAWNHVRQLTAEQRARGVVAASSGNHAKALAWAAARAGVPATVCMPANAYRSKIAAARAYGAEVVLTEDRRGSDEHAVALAAEGAVLVPPYDHRNTLEGQGTVALEILQQWPEVDALAVPVGGGGLFAGCCLVWRDAGRDLPVLGVEPEGAAAMTASLAAGSAVQLERVDSAIQGLTPPGAGRATHAVAQAADARTVTLSDAEILAGQRRLVERGWTVEPAGAAAPAAVFLDRLPAAWRERAAERPLRVAALVSGGNPDPDQLAGLRAELAHDASAT
ncbi:MAG: threonine ammonia-lyase [Planctomycetota bacterium]|jgi:threonine dehydratase